MDCKRCGGPTSVQGKVCDECHDRPVRRSTVPAKKVLTPRQQRAADALRNRFRSEVK